MPQFYATLVGEYFGVLTLRLSQPFGVFRRRWGDAGVRFLTMAMFAEEREIVRTEVKGYEHPCGAPL